MTMHTIGLTWGCDMRRLRTAALALALAALPALALAQSSAGGGGGGGSGGTVSVSNFPATQPVSGTFWQATQPVSGTVAATQSGTWNTGLTGSLPAFAATPTFNVGTTNGLALDATVSARLGTLGQKASTGSAPVVLASDQSSIPVSAVLNGGTATVFGAGNFAIGTSAAAGGLAAVNRLPSSAATTNATLIKGATGRVYKVTGWNANASVRWLHFYNVAAAPTPGTTTVFFALPLPPGAFSFDAADIGYSFSTGIAYSVTTGASDSDATAVAAGDILNLNVWVQ